MVRLEFAALRSNLVNLPHSIASGVFNLNLPTHKIIVELVFQSRKIYLGWSGLYSTNEAIEIDPAVAFNLQLPDNADVKINLKTNAEEAHVVHLEPLTFEDWAVFESNAVFLESFLINQVRAVQVNQILTVFPSQTLIASVKITKIEPQNEYAFLSNTSEVIVKPKIGGDDTKVEEKIRKLKLNDKVVRYCSWASESRKLEVYGDLPFSGFVQVRLLLHTNFKVIAKYVQTDKKFRVDRVGVSRGLATALKKTKNSLINTRVVISPVEGNLDIKLKRLTLHPFTLEGTSTKSVTSKPAKLSDNQLKSLELTYACGGLCIPPIDDFLKLGGVLETEGKEDNVWGLPNEVILGEPKVISESENLFPKVKIDRPVVGHNNVYVNLMKQCFSGAGILLYGSRGCGKTALVNKVINELREREIHVIQFKCSQYTDKALQTCRDAFKKVSLEACWCAPSTIVFDDIDKMIPKEHEQGGDSDRLKRLADVFCDIWRPLMDSGQVSLIATAQSESSVHSTLLNTHLLDNVIKLKSPDKDLREKILMTAMQIAEIKLSTDFDIVDVVHETEGYQPGDLWTLVDRLSCCVDGELTLEKFIEAKGDYVPMSRRSVKLDMGETIKWSDVGGLEDVKRVVLETLEWPTKYAPVFENCPLRLRSGLLFYGYPGCGKTMLASAIANQTGLNFISVKGPEILNKYIGASEQSIRDLFDRAQAAKPCVLFFDEFDSIAPKRGHDSTGVTDRVVNQLLTQMDGAEGLDGVYVLAATSRPDLIDSALLRPGRLDRSLLCDLPNKEDRLDILLRATSTMNLDKDVDLKDVANKTNRYTGADLQAVAYDAYLNAVHRVLADREIKPETTESDDRKVRNAFQIGNGSHDIQTAFNYVSEENTDQLDTQDDVSTNTVVITNDDMQGSLKSSKPSISDKELKRFEKIYSEFRNDRNGEMPPGTSSNEIGQRVTLQ